MFEERFYFKEQEVLNEKEGIRKRVSYHRRR